MSLFQKMLAIANNAPSSLQRGVDMARRKAMLSKGLNSPPAGPPGTTAPPTRGTDPNLGLLMLTQPKFQVHRDMSGKIIIPGQEKPSGLDELYANNPGLNPRAAMATGQPTAQVGAGPADPLKAFYAARQVAPQPAQQGAPVMGPAQPVPTDPAAIEAMNNARLGARRAAQGDQFFGDPASQAAYFAGQAPPEIFRAPGDLTGPKPGFKETPESLRMKAMYAKRYGTPGNPSQALRSMIKSGY